MNNIADVINKAILILIIIMLLLAATSHFPNNVLSWDIFGYYLYLPLLFIYQDIGLKDYTIIQNIIDTYQNTSTFYQAMPSHDGNWVLKYPMGMSLLYSPWFLVGHIWAWLSTYPSDGFSYPYQASLLYGSFLYTAYGLFVYWKSMRRLFDPTTVTILIIIIVLGTNYLVHTVFHGQGLMSHNYLFTLFALILYFTIKWHEKPSLKYAAGLGIVIGIAALSRPTELLVTIVPVLWNIKDKADLHAKIQLFIRNWKSMLIAALIILFFGSLQLVYFKLYTGKFLFNSYSNNAGEGMDFLRPYIIEVLFSFRKGWLVYTPVMIFSLLGFYYLYQQRREFFYSISVYFIITFYVVASWSCWWYADCMSQRALIPAYVFLSLPLGQLIKTVMSRNNWRKYIFLITTILLLLINLFQSWQFIHGIIHTSRMTKEYYYAVFLKKFIPSYAHDLLLVDRSQTPENLLFGGKQYQQSVLYDMTFEDIHLSEDSANDTIIGYKIQRENPFSPSFETSYDELLIEEYGIIEVKFSVFARIDPSVNPFSMVATFSHEGSAYSYQGINVGSGSVKTNSWSDLSMLYLTPEARHKRDTFKSYLWLHGSYPVYIRNLKVIIHRPV